MSISIKNLNSLVISFLSENKSKDCDLLELWKSKDVQNKVKTLVPKQKVIKDPNAPKRAKSGYLFFCESKREEVKKQLGKDAKSIDIIKKLGEIWRQLTSSKKAADVKLVASFNKKAEEDKKRYEKEKSNYVKPSQEELQKSKPKLPKRARTSYLFFCEQNREKVKKDHPKFKGTEITTELGKRWKQLTSSKKAADVKLVASFNKKAEEDKQRYQREKEEMNK